jgi:hypothetical protein
VLFTGWRLKEAILAQELSGAGELLGRGLMVFVRYIAPVFMALILLAPIIGPLWLKVAPYLPEWATNRLFVRLVLLGIVLSFVAGAKIFRSRRVKD